MLSHNKLVKNVSEEITDLKVDPALVLRLLIASELNSRQTGDGWAFLRDVRDTAEAEYQSTTKRAIAVLHDLELWESRDNPERRTEKLVRLTTKGRYTLQVLLKSQ